MQSEAMIERARLVLASQGDDPATFDETNPTHREFAEAAATYIQVYTSANTAAFNSDPEPPRAEVDAAETRLRAALAAYRETV